MYQRPDGKFQGTWIYKTIEECIYQGLAEYCWSADEIQNRFTNDYKVVTKAPLFLEPGTNVEILEIAKEAPEYYDWHDDAKSMVGKKGFEIRISSNDGYWVYTKDKSDFWAFPLWAVAACGDEEPETIEIGGEKYIKSKELVEALKNLKKA